MHYVTFVLFGLTFTWFMVTAEQAMHSHEC